MDRFLLNCLFLLPYLAVGQSVFTDQTSAAGLSHTGKNYGAAVADFDNDGWEDIYALTFDEPCQLYRNNADGTFTEVAEEAGVAFVGHASAVAWADIDNDGWLDLMVGSREEGNALYRNNGDGTFTDITESAGVAEGQKVKGILFSDIDMDGFVDIYIVRFFMENILLMNNGDLTFTDESAWANADDNGMSMGALFFDYDHDGDPDLYLTRDGNQSFILYQNLGNGKFVDVSLQSGTNIVAMGMGVDVGDVNNDGWLDIYVTNLGANSLLINDGIDGFFGPSFEEIAIEAGAGDIGMGWGTIFLDIDNDGWQDIYLANDSHYSPMPNLLLKNNGDHTFSSMGEGGAEASMEASYGVVSTDVNNDGTMDIFVTNNNHGGNQLFINETENENNWVKINAVGTESNRAGIGAKVTLEFDGKIQSDEIISGSSYSSQNSLILHFGIGEAEVVDKLTIRWPNGLVETYEQLSINTKHILVEGEGLFSNIGDIEKTEKEITVHPVPFQNELTISFAYFNEKNITIELYDNRGKLFLRKENQPIVSNQYTLDFSNIDLIPNIYYLRINSENQIRTFRIIKG